MINKKKKTEEIEEMGDLEGNEKFNDTEEWEETDNTQESPLKAILAIFLFELEKKKLIFGVFLFISAFMVLSISVFPYFIFADYVLPTSMFYYFQEGFGYLYYLIIFSVCFFFSGIICEEYDYNTGYLTFPIVNRFKLIFGKYLSNFTMVLIILSAFYITLGLAGSMFFSEPVPGEFLLSFLIATLFVLTISSFVTFLSAIMKNVGITIITCLLVLLIGEDILTFFFSDPEVEPLYSLVYMSSLIFYILDYPNPRFYKVERGPFVRVTWITPSVEIAIILMSIYTAIYFIFAILIFRKRQLK